MDAKEEQSCSDILMIRPCRFLSNPETAESNHFQQPDKSINVDTQQMLALAEFDSLAKALQEAGIHVIIIDDTLEPHTPDSIFPNNWISFHGDGTVVLYPMAAPNRRAERRSDIVEAISTSYCVKQVLDLTAHEQDNAFLEGTGSVVLDRTHRIAYACLSARTNYQVLEDFARQLSYEVVAFEARDGNGFPIYHTNVMMSVGKSLAVICLDAITNPVHRDLVVSRLEQTGHVIVKLTLEQMNSFAGNMLELQNSDGKLFAMSGQAWGCLNEEQRGILRGNGQVLSVPIPNIEINSGGSVRCMIAEIHLPRSS